MTKTEAIEILKMNGLVIEPSAVGLGPFIKEKPTYKHCDIFFRSGQLWISTSGTWLISEEAEQLAKDLKEAAALIDIYNKATD